MPIFISPWVRCLCGKLHVVEMPTVCPSCKRPLSPWEKQNG